jgi:hypothetical protein
LTKSDKPLARLVRFSSASGAKGADIMKACNALPAVVWAEAIISEVREVSSVSD